MRPDAESLPSWLCDLLADGAVPASNGPTLELPQPSPKTDGAVGTGNGPAPKSVHFQLLEKKVKKSKKGEWQSRGDGITMPAPGVANNQDWIGWFETQCADAIGSLRRSLTPPSNRELKPFLSNYQPDTRDVSAFTSAGTFTFGSASKGAEKGRLGCVFRLNEDGGFVNRNEMVKRGRAEWELRQEGDFKMFLGYLCPNCESCCLPPVRVGSGDQCKECDKRAGRAKRKNIPLGRGIPSQSCDSRGTNRLSHLVEWVPSQQ